MQIKMIARGKGGGSEPANYLLRESGCNQTPEVLRDSDPERTRALIDSLSSKWC
ncbi:hypothetical protein [Labrys sp. 22185]|uniref:hypothetical protein n=1 Tax=Labrys sp. 22185 TaxID=3453888 RepID=UPI003F843070